jgi:hypothetical protein
VKKGGTVMSELRRQDLFTYLSDVRNEVSIRDFSADPENLKAGEKEGYYLRKGMSVLAKELIERFDLEASPP